MRKRVAEMLDQPVKPRSKQRTAQENREDVKTWHKKRTHLAEQYVCHRWGPSVFGASLRTEHTHSLQGHLDRLANSGLSRAERISSWRGGLGLAFFFFARAEQGFGG